MDFKNENKKLNIRLINDETYFYWDSLQIIRTITINDSTIKEEIVCDLSNSIIPEEESFWSSINFTTSNVKECRYIDQYGYPLNYNTDSSFALLIEDNISEYKNYTAIVYLIDIKNCDSKKVTEIETSSNYIFEKVSFSNHEDRIYYVGSPAKWINKNEFVVGSKGGLYLFNINKLQNSIELLEANVYSDFLISGKYLINQTTTGIDVIDYANKTKINLLNDNFSSGLMMTNKYLYFAKGWSLYKCLLDSIPHYQKIFYGNNTIKDYFIIDDNQFIVLCGGLASIPESNTIYFFNLDTNENFTIDETTFLKDYYLTTDKRYFIIKKKMIQFKNYDVTTVFDIDSKIKYEFDSNSFTN